MEVGLLLPGAGLGGLQEKGAFGPRTICLEKSLSTKILSVIQIGKGLPETPKVLLAPCSRLRHPLPYPLLPLRVLIKEPLVTKHTQTGPPPHKLKRKKKVLFNQLDCWAATLGQGWI